MRLLFVALTILFTSVTQAAIESRKFETSLQELRYNELIKELRCLVCQNQNLADSNASLAQDLREKTYAMIMAGQTDGQIADFMVDRYGEFVLYRPPLNIHTILLWLAPALLGLFGIFVFVKLVRKRQTDIVVEQDRLDQVRDLLDDNKGA
ncbi:MAG: cytochrome c-type biogenesis protein CcmH [Parasphingorhabdus sp.]|jgi:cytochrome c-type biogenesis protein CcmH